jgi:hypothetical protein
VIEPGLYYSEMTYGLYQAQGKAELHTIKVGDEEDMAGVILWLLLRAGA